jgi:hypothetical protein
VGLTYSHKSGSLYTADCVIEELVYVVQGDTKKREVLKNPTKIEEIREKNNY